MAEEHERPEHTHQAGMRRRTLLRWVVGVGAFSSLAALASVLGTVKPPQTAQRGEKIKAGDVLVFALGQNKGAPLTPTSIVPQQAVLAFPQGKAVQDNLIILINLRRSQFIPPTHLNWLPDGYVAYSAICTHLGCTVGFSHEPMPGVPYPHIHCPCHQGMYNPLAGAEVVAGPPPRPLPQLPLVLNAKGELVADGPFDGPVGPLPGGR